MRTFREKAPTTLLIGICVALLGGCSREPELKQQLLANEAQLEILPKLQPNMLCPTVGFGSAIFSDPEQTTWLDIILPEPRQLDTIVLVPALLKNKSGELETLGFPLRFTIETWQGKKPGTQHVKLEKDGWIYQPVGIYDPANHPEELVCTFSMNQLRFGAGSAPVSVSLHYASDFTPEDDIDVKNAAGVIQVGTPQIVEPWSVWATSQGKHGPRQIEVRFKLAGVPVGSTLFLRMANDSPRKNAALDDIGVNPPFLLSNGDFESPAIPIHGVHHDVTDWYDNTQEWMATQQGAYFAAPSYDTGGVIIDHSLSDFPNPGAAPVVFNLPPGTEARKVRIRSVHMQKEISWRKEKGHNFSLNEVLLFDGQENVALNTRAASSDHENFPLMFHTKYAIDGYSYFPPVDPKEVSSPTIELINDDANSSKLLFDLGRTYTLNEARFYPVDRSPQFSHVYAMGIGFPRKITMRISDQPNPESAPLTFSIDTPHQIGASPLMHRLESPSGRYIWIEMDEGQRDPRTDTEALGFSEIEFLQNGTNVLGGIQPSQSAGSEYSHLTDGLTSSGVIIPQKEWLLNLNRRSLLERKGEKLILRQQQQSERQQRMLGILQGILLTSLLAASIITLIVRSRHRHHLRRLREKIGANLHDEVGANLSSIALSSELLEHAGQLDSKRAHGLICDIRRIASETATEIRLLSRFLEKQGVESNLIGQLRRIEKQMLPGLQTSSDFAAPDQFNALAPIEKWELVLFFKEALHNIVKHSQATRVTIETSAAHRQLQLEITDNGKGLPDNTPAPVHLAKRAKMLRAQLSIESSEKNGTRIRLVIPLKRRFRK